MGVEHDIHIISRPQNIAMKAPFRRRTMVALVVRGKIHGDEVLRLHALMGQTRRRDQHAAGYPVREIAGCALVEAASVQPGHIRQSLAPDSRWHADLADESAL